MDHPFVDFPTSDTPALGVMSLYEARAALEAVARLCGLTSEDLLGASRDSLHVAGRAALYKRLRAGKWSFPMIGRFVGRHHTSIMHALDAGHVAKRKRGSRGVMLLGGMAAE